MTPRKPGAKARAPRKPRFTWQLSAHEADELFERRVYVKGGLVIGAKDMRSLAARLQRAAAWAEHQKKGSK